MINPTPNNGRNFGDQYFSPPWVVDGLLSVIQPKGHIIEPCAGEGHLADRLRDYGYTVTESDIDPTLRGKARDFLSDDFNEEAEWVVTNPPYTIKGGPRASDFYRQAMEVATKGVAMLLRLSWLEACRDRKDKLPKLTRVAIFPSPRVQYIGSGSSNPAQSAWFIWTPEGVTKPMEVEYISPEVLDGLR